MLTDKARNVSFALLTAIALVASGVGIGVLATAAPVPGQKPVPAEEAAAIKASAALMKQHVEGRRWRLEKVDVKKGTFDLEERSVPADGFVRLWVVNNNANAKPELPRNRLVGLELVPRPTITLDGQPAGLADLKPGHFVLLRVAEGSARLEQVMAFTDAEPETYILKDIDGKARTATVEMPSLKLTLKGLPLAKDVKVYALQLAPPPPPPQQPNGVWVVGGPRPTETREVTIGEVKPGTKVALQLGIENSRYVIKTITFVR